MDALLKADVQTQVPESDVFPVAQIVEACRHMLTGCLRDHQPPQAASAGFHRPACMRLDVGLRARGVLRAMKTGSGASTEANGSLAVWMK